jgi:multiple sugar transport system substrate-binding protein
MPIDLGSLVGRGNRLVYILVGAIALFVFFTVIVVLRSFSSNGGGEKIVLQFWGVFDDKSAFEQAMREFEDEHPGVDIIYTRFSFQDYERDAVDALAGDNGPDVWMIHNTWLPKHIDKLEPMPDRVGVKRDPFITIRDFKEKFVDVTFNDLVKDDKIYSLPLYVDTLALYYNKDLLNSAGFSRPPKTWNEFNEYVKKLTEQDSRSNIIRSGAAIGSVRNINRSTDILMALMIQSGVRMTNASNTEATFAKSVDNLKPGETALQYYTDFTNSIKQTYCWNDNMHYSVDAFTESTAAMMFNYSHQIGLLRDKAPRLNFAVGAIPQLSEADARTYASYWAPAVTKASKHPVEAWEFVNFLTSRNRVVSYLNATNRPAALREFIDIQSNDPNLGVFAEQALSARSWYQIDNAAIETIFAEMIDSVNFGRASVKDALQNAQSQVNVLMQARR